MVGTDYFTKWVEIEPLANIRDVDVKRFVQKNITLGSESLIPSSRTMDSNLIVKPLRDTAVT